MDLPALIGRLSASAASIEALVTALPEEVARWKPVPERWSVLEVINHLADEEVEDFRMRVDLTLHHPERDWPPIDPEGWVAARAYQQRDPSESLARWREERRRSLEWLAGLSAPEWERAHAHPALGSLRAGDVLASWVAHDLLHLRQLLRLHFEWLARHAEPFSTRYAGPW
jgi:hypothetical protein